MLPHLNPDPPDFKKGERLTADKMNSLAARIAQILRSRFGFAIQRPLNIIGKLDGDLAPATAFADDPSTATMSVWVRNVSGNLEDSGRNETIVNRFVNSSPILATTIVKAEWIEGEWQLYAADCSEPA